MENFFIDKKSEACAKRQIDIYKSCGVPESYLDVKGDVAFLEGAAVAIEDTYSIAVHNVLSFLQHAVNENENVKVSEIIKKFIYKK